MPAMTSRMTSLLAKVPTRRVCSCSSREFQYTCVHNALPDQACALEYALNVGCVGTKVCRASFIRSSL